MPGDFTKLTSYRVVSIEASVFVCGSHGVNAMLEEPGFQLVVRYEVLLVDSVCQCVCLYILLVRSHWCVDNQSTCVFVFVQELGNISLTKQQSQFVR